MTKYEREIFAMIHTSCEHLTAKQIFQNLKQVYPSVVLATVYNNLNRLLEMGLIRKISIEGMPDRYDRTQKHDHLVCQCCGKLTDISLDDLTAVLRAQLKEEFFFYDLKVYTLCPACRAKEK